MIQQNWIKTFLKDTSGGSESDHKRLWQEIDKTCKASPNKTFFMDRGKNLTLQETVSAFSFGCVSWNTTDDKEPGYIVAYF